MNNRQVPTDFLFFAAGWVALAGSEIFLVPFLTRVFSTAEYGRYLLTFGFLLFLSDAASIWASTSFVRQAATDYDGVARDHIRSVLLTAVIIASSIPIIGVAICAVFAAKVGSSLIDTSLFAGTFMIPALATLSFALADCQAAGRSSRFSVLCWARMLTMTIGGVLATVAFQPTATIFLLGASVCLTILVIPYWVRYTRVPSQRGEDWLIVRKALLFGLGMWFQNLGAKVLRVGDRYVLGALLGAAAVAVYGSGYVLLFGAVTLFVSPLITQITPIVFRVADLDGDDAVSDTIRKILSLYIPLVAFAVSIIYAFSSLALKIALPAEYSHRFSPTMTIAIVVAAGIHGATLIINLVFSIKRNTIIPALLFIIISGVNVAGNLIFVPNYNIKAAAIVTIFTYMLLCYLTYVLARRLIKITIDPIPMVASFCGVAIAFFAKSLAYNSSEWISTIVSIVVAIIWFTILLSVNPVLRKQVFMRIESRRGAGVALEISSSSHRGV